jgi:hypothetical protein
LKALAAEDEGPDIVIDHPAVDGDDDDFILLERHHIKNVIIDLDVCG